MNEFLVTCQYRATASDLPLYDIFAPTKNSSFEVSDDVIACDLAPPQSKILATPMAISDRVYEASATKTVNIPALIPGQTKDYKNWYSQLRCLTFSNKSGSVTFFPPTATFDVAGPPWTGLFLIEVGVIRLCG